MNGVNTLLQSFVGTRLPAFINRSSSYTMIVLLLVQSDRYTSILDRNEKFVATMKSLQGALIVASIFHMIVSFLGIWRLILRLLCPLSTFALVTLVGLGFYDSTFRKLAECAAVGFPGFATLIFISQCLPRLMTKRRTVLERYALILSMALMGLYSYVLTVSKAYRNCSEHICCYDTSLLFHSPWIKIPYPLQWGKPTFILEESVGMMAACLVALIESTGTYILLSRYGGAPPIPPYALSRGIGWQGVGLFLDALFGTITGSTASSVNVGQLFMTRTGNSRVIRVAALMMLFFAIFGKLNAFFAAIPLSLFASLSCILYGCQVCAGFEFLPSCNLNNSRRKLVLATSLFMGLSVPSYMFSKSDPGAHLVDRRSIMLYSFLNVPFMSGTTVAVLVVLLLDVFSIGWKIQKGSALPWLEISNTNQQSEQLYSVRFAIHDSSQKVFIYLSNVLVE